MRPTIRQRLRVGQRHTSFRIDVCCPRGKLEALDRRGLIAGLSHDAGRSMRHDQDDYGDEYWIVSQ